MPGRRGRCTAIPAGDRRTCTCVRCELAASSGPPPVPVRRSPAAHPCIGSSIPFLRHGSRMSSSESLILPTILDAGLDRAHDWARPRGRRSPAKRGQGGRGAAAHCDAPTSAVSPGRETGSPKKAVATPLAALSARAETNAKPLPVALARGDEANVRRRSARPRRAKSVEQPTLTTWFPTGRPSAGGAVIRAARAHPARRRQCAVKRPPAEVTGPQ